MWAHSFQITFNGILKNRSNWKSHLVPTSTPVAGVMQQSHWMECENWVLSQARWINSALATVQGNICAMAALFACFGWEPWDSQSCPGQWNLLLQHMNLLWCWDPQQRIIHPFSSIQLLLPLLHCPGQSELSTAVWEVLQEISQNSGSFLE